LRRFWQGRKTLRVRLTAWYILLLGCTLIVFNSYLYLQLKYNLLVQIDTTLKITASEVLTNLTIQQEHLSLNNREQFKANQQQLVHAGLIARFIDTKNNITGGFGNYQVIKTFLPQKKGYHNLSVRGTTWRVYSLPLAIANSQIIEASPKSNPQTHLWLQVAQSLQPITKALDHLLTLILFALPLVLLFAGFGGLFLANRALSPINKIIRTAEAINPDDLSYRINYQGVTDEVGRLAMTLDRMLDRIELAFEHERRFIADASHELRTPLTVIKGQIGVALSRQRTPAVYQATLQDVESQADRLIHLTNGLLLLARLEQEQLQGQENFWQVDLSNLLEILAEQIQPIAKDKQIDFQVEIVPDIWILGNCDLLTSLFLNLLDNAIKYTPVGGQVSLTTRKDQQTIAISTSNTGEGIATEKLPYLFDRFYRLERDRNKNTKGTGLGLAIASLITRCHGGQITVSSQINQLTTFEVTLPL
jgi:heavy metal sensor kinase